MTTLAGSSTLAELKLRIESREARIGIVGLVLAFWLVPVLPTQAHRFDLIGQRKAEYF